MICSMTGFGKATVSVHKKRLTIEASSVNSRYLEISLRLPKAFSDFENEVRRLIGEKIARGKIFISASFDDNTVGAEQLVLNREVAKMYHRMFMALKRELKLTGEVSLAHFTSLPDLFSAQTSSAVARSDVNQLLAGISRALSSMQKMRLAEGKSMAADMHGRVRTISKFVEGLRPQQASGLEQYRERILRLIEDAAQAAAGAPLGNGNTKLRIEMEIALLADKADITEECVRLRSHAKAFENALRASGDAGKRLNFILQEMNREANTIGSKSLVYEVSSAVITIKEEIEKLREQVQNIE